MDGDRRLERWRQARAAHLSRLGWVAQDVTGSRPVRYVAGELLVAVEDGDEARRAVSRLGIRSGEVTEDEPLPGVRRLRARGLDGVRASRQAREQRAEARVSPNHVLVATPHDQGGPFGRPIVAEAGTIDATAAPDGTARVVVLDTGVWADSPLPTTRYRVDPDDYESDVDVDRDNVIDSDVGHANFIAGVILRGTRQAQVRIVKVLDTFGVTTELDLATRIIGLSDVDILNLSLGAFTDNDQPPILLGIALNRFLAAEDRIVVAAAGNDGSADRPFWPAAFSRAGRPWSDQVIAVGAHDGSAVCSWSNTGPWIDLVAPGQDVVSTYLHHPEFSTGWAAWSGTSFATPYVVAALAELTTGTGSARLAAKQLLAVINGAIGGYAALS
jgi:subtilisin family serine protease